MIADRDMQGARTPTWTPVGVIAAASAAADDRGVREKERVMSLLWIIVFCVVALVWVLSIVDIVRQHYSGWTTAAWLALIVILPIIGSIIYWFARTPTSEDAEQQYLAEADRRRSAGARPFDSTGMGP